MRTRWFGMVDIRDGMYALFRMDMDDDAQTMATFMWDRQADDWVDDNARLVGYLVKGDPRLDEITQQQAQDFAPRAFS